MVSFTLQGNTTGLSRALRNRHQKTRVLPCGMKVNEQEVGSDTQRTTNFEHHSPKKCSCVHNSINGRSDHMPIAEHLWIMMLSEHFPNSGLLS